MGLQFVQFNETARIQKHIYAFPGGEFSGLMLLVNTGLPPGQFSLIFQIGQSLTGFLKIIMVTHVASLPLYGLNWIFYGNHPIRNTYIIIANFWQTETFNQGFPGQ
jgi:hypothetical protein